VLPVRRLAKNGYEAWAEVIAHDYEGLGRQGRGEPVRSGADEALAEGEAARLDRRGGPLAATDQCWRGRMRRRTGRQTTVAEIYRGSVVSKTLALLSVALLIAGILAMLAAEWLPFLYAIAASTLAAYGGYRAAGRRDPERAEATWAKKDRIEIVPGQAASWPAKVEAMFSMWEEEARGNYGAALAALKILILPSIVESAYMDAVRAPSRDSWDRLKRAFLENPPGR